MVRKIDKWTLEAQLAQGASATVYRVSDEQGRRGALKLYRSSDADLLDRPSLELVSQIAHENLSELIDHGQSATGQPFIVTRYVDGRSLKEYLEHDFLATPEAVRETAVIEIGIAIARALGALHAHKLVHRDVKPSNILIPEGAKFSQAKLIDLDFLGQRQTSSNVTMSGVLVGTPAYMSPEQAMGSGLTHRADLWSLGVVLYQVATLRLPFEADSAVTILSAILTREPNFDSVPARLRSVLRSALQKSPDERVPDAASFEHVLSLCREPLQVPSCVPKPTGLDASVQALPQAPSQAPISFESATLPPATQSKAAPGWLSLTPVVAIIVCVLGTLVIVSPPGDWLRPVIALSAALAVSALIWAIFKFTERSRSSQARKIRARAARESRATASMVVAVRDLAEHYSCHPHANLITRSMALVLENYSAIENADPQTKLELTLKALDAVFRFEARISQLTAPWYQRHEKAVTIFGALGTACVTWFGLGQSVFEPAASSGAQLIRGCPEQAITRRMRVRLEATGTNETLTWSLGERVLLVSPSFRFPEDLDTALEPGVYVLSASSAKQRERCVIEVE